MTTAPCLNAMTALPEVALSINQPWAALIAHGLKPIENRGWNTSWRGEFLIHTGKNVDREAGEEMLAGRHPVTGDPFDGGDMTLADLRQGGMIGIARLVDVIRGHKDLARFEGKIDTSWFVGKYGLVIAEARPIEFIPCVGALGFFEPNYDLTYKPKPEPKSKTPRASKNVRDVGAPQGGLFD